MKKWIVVLSMLIAGGCAHVPAEQAKPEGPVPRGALSVPLVQKAIVKGKTTKTEILAKFGAPNSVARPPVGAPASAIAETWNYWTTPPLSTLGQGGQFNVFRMTIVFDAAGVAQDYQAGENMVRLD